MHTSIVRRLGGGEFFDYIIEKDYLDEMEAIHYIKQMLDALGYLHGKSIIHLDLKVIQLCIYNISDYYSKTFFFSLELIFVQYINFLVVDVVLA